MLGTCGEYIVDATNTTDDIATKIQEYETSLNLNTLPSPFVIKKIGIKPNAECTLKINGRPFILQENTSLEFGYNVFDIYSIVSDTNDVKLVIRYLY